MHHYSVAVGSIESVLQRLQLYSFEVEGLYLSIKPIKFNISLISYS